jgi:hypothetical protein
MNGMWYDERADFVGRQELTGWKYIDQIVKLPLSLQRFGSVDGSRLLCISQWSCFAFPGGRCGQQWALSQVHALGQRHNCTR